jgi:hypothetical protein
VKSVARDYLPIRVFSVFRGWKTKHTGKKGRIDRVAAIKIASAPEQEPFDDRSYAMISALKKQNAKPSEINPKEPPVSL